MTDIDVEIEGVPDRRVVARILERVRIVGREVVRPGEWRVMVAPSERRGEWDLGVRAPSGWRIASSTDPVDTLPDFVERTLRESLQRPVDGQGDSLTVRHAAPTRRRVETC